MAKFPWIPVIALAAVAGGVAVAAGRGKAVGLEFFEDTGSMVEAMLEEGCLVGIVVHESLLGAAQDAVGAEPGVRVVATTDRAAVGNLPDGARWRVVAKDDPGSADTAHVGTGTDEAGLVEAIHRAIPIVEACLGGAPVSDHDFDDDLEDEFEEYESILLEGMWVTDLEPAEAGQLADAFGEAFGTGDEGLLTCPNHAVVIAADKGAEFTVWTEGGPGAGSVYTTNQVELSDATLMEIVLLDDFSGNRVHVEIHYDDPENPVAALDIVADTAESCLGWAV